MPMGGFHQSDVSPCRRLLCDGRGREGEGEGCTCVPLPDPPDLLPWLFVVSLLSPVRVHAVYIRNGISPLIDGRSAGRSQKVKKKGIEGEAMPCHDINGHGLTACDAIFGLFKENFICKVIREIETDWIEGPLMPSDAAGDCVIKESSNVGEEPTQERCPPLFVASSSTAAATAYLKSASIWSMSMSRPLHSNLENTCHLLRQ